MKIYFLLNMILICTSIVAYAQHGDIVTGKLGTPMNIGVIDEDGSVETRALENIALALRLSRNAINYSGDVIFSNNTLYFEKDAKWNTKVLPLPDNARIHSPKLNRDGSILAYVLHVDEFASIQFVDTNTLEMVDQLIELRTFHLDNIEFFDTDKNCANFTYAYLEPGTDPAGYAIYAANRNVDSFNKNLVDKVTSISSRIYMSDDGNKIVYRAIKRINGEKINSIYEAKRVGDEWSVPEKIDLPDIVYNGNTYPAYLHGISNNGNRLIVSCGKNGLAFVDFENDEWSQPSYMNYFAKPKDRIKVTKDSDTLFVMNNKTPDERHFQEYDLFMLSNRNGNWINNRISDSASNNGSTIISGDGKRVVWSAGN